MNMVLKHVPDKFKLVKMFLDSHHCIKLIITINNVEFVATDRSEKEAINKVLSFGYDYLLSYKNPETQHFRNALLSKFKNDILEICPNNINGKTYDCNNSNSNYINFSFISNSFAPFKQSSNCPTCLLKK